MNKAEFMTKLESSLEKYAVPDAREILLDFEQHFEDGVLAGETEAQVCEKLGDPDEIAEQYIPDTDICIEDKKTAKTSEIPKSDGFDTNGYTQVPNAAPMQAKQFQPDAGTVVGIVLIDLIVLSWALPSLASLVCALYGTTVGIGVSGIAVFFAGILSAIIDTSTWLFTSLSPVSTTLLGVVLMSATVLLIIACVAATKGFINVCKHIINWHSRAFVGRNVCTIKKGEAK